MLSTFDFHVAIVAAEILAFCFDQLEAAQRGVKCTRQILLGLVENTQFAEGTPIFVCDMIHSKFLNRSKIG